MGTNEVAVARFLLDRFGGIGLYHFTDKDGRGGGDQWLRPDPVPWGQQWARLAKGSLTAEAPNDEGHPRHCPKGGG